MHLVIAGFGQVAKHKYLDLVWEGLASGQIGSYSIIDLETQKLRIQDDVSTLQYVPAEINYLPDRSSEGIWALEADFEPVLHRLQRRYGLVKLLITTEVKAHEAYLRFCVAQNIDSLVEKPVLLPMLNGKFMANGMSSRMEEIVDAARANTASHSVMSLGRYHQFFEDDVRIPIQSVMNQFKSPITSFHLRTNSGVWNLMDEYSWREDHPYKYGYGMLMHGAYHYVDIMATFLEMNKNIYPEKRFELTLSSYTATPPDQPIRIRENLYDSFTGGNVATVGALEDMSAYGETDIVTAFRMHDKNTGQTLTVGTLGFEQTSPSMRHWREVPEKIYNRNGRMSFTEIEAQISTIFSINGRLMKIPNPYQKDELSPSARSYAESTIRANPTIVKHHEYVELKVRDTFTKTSKNELIRAWLRGDEQKSTIGNHLVSMTILELIARSLDTPGYPVTAPLF